jgi:A/G-specific adenine glycosylase
VTRRKPGQHTSPHPPEAFHDATWLRSARSRLLRWYRAHARDLPWRRTRDPYHVWLSEIMLQQTQVATVIPYFERFLATLPTIADLAAAQEHQVLRLWEGLGYYRRARQLHAAAKHMVENHAGRFPDAFDDVIQLPGIGRYTAGAILSIAFDVPAPIVEANTIRLYSRLWRFDGDPTTRAGQTLLWGAAEALLPKRGAGEINQALMELGSQVCLPRAPLCEACPLADLCPTRAAGLHEQIPRPKSKPRVTPVRHLLLAIERRDKFLLRKGRDGDRWAGLWDFPRFELANGDRVIDSTAVAQVIAAELGGPISIGEQLATWRHTVTRYRIELNCHAARVQARELRGKTSHEQQWFTLQEIAELPLNTTGRKLYRLLAERVER